MKNEWYQMIQINGELSSGGLGGLFSSWASSLAKRFLEIESNASKLSGIDLHAKTHFPDWTVHSCVLMEWLDKHTWAILNNLQKGEYGGFEYKEQDNSKYKYIQSHTDKGPEKDNKNNQYSIYFGEHHIFPRNKQIYFL